MAKLKEIKNEITKNFNLFKSHVNDLLTATDFKVEDFSLGYSGSSVKLGIFDKAGVAVFGSSINICLERDMFGKVKYKLITSIGTTGEFDIEDTSLDARANFYIQVGKLLGDSELIGNIRNSMIIYGAAISELQKEYSELIEKEA